MRRENDEFIPRKESKEEEKMRNLKSTVSNEGNTEQRETNYEARADQFFHEAQEFLVGATDNGERAYRGSQVVAAMRRSERDTSQLLPHVRQWITEAQASPDKVNKFGLFSIQLPKIEGRLVSESRDAEESLQATLNNRKRSFYEAGNVPPITWLEENVFSDPHHSKVREDEKRHASIKASVQEALQLAEKGQDPLSALDAAKQAARHSYSPEEGAIYAAIAHLETQLGCDPQQTLDAAREAIRNDRDPAHRAKQFGALAVVEGSIGADPELTLEGGREHADTYRYFQPWIYYDIILAEMILHRDPTKTYTRLKERFQREPGNHEAVASIAAYMGEYFADLAKSSRQKK